LQRGQIEACGEVGGDFVFRNIEAAYRHRSDLRVALALRVLPSGPFRVQVIRLPSKSTAKVFFCRFGRKVVVWPRSAGSGEKVLSGPAGMVTATLLVLS
jgi:hypothetical protein